MRRFMIILGALLLILILTGCAADMNRFEKTPGPEGEIAGFWQGLWHGVIAPFAFIISLFSDSVGVYEVYNNGNWYNLGFMIGISVLLGGGSKGTCKKRN